MTTRQSSRGRFTAATLGGMLALTMAACSSGSDAPVADATSAPASTSSSASSSTTSSPTAAPDAKALAQKSVANAKAAKSGRFAGTIVTDGTTIDISSFGMLDNSAVETTLKQGDVADARYRVIGSDAYISGNEQFWLRRKEPAATAKQLGASHQWKKVPASDIQNVIKGSTIGGLVDRLSEGTGLLDKGTPAMTSEQVEGLDCWVLTDPGTSGLSFALAKDTSLPVRLAPGNNQGSLVFDQWGTAEVPTAPPASEIYTP